jgi:hypothetical protein
MAAAIALGPSSRAAAAEEAGPLRVYVVVVDGMTPEEVDGTTTPTLQSLKDGGTWYQQARAVFPAETLPNHVAMATGTLPTRNGIIGNQFWRAESGQSKEYMEHPGLLQEDTIVTRLERACAAREGDVASATVLSKTYLYNAFRGEPAGESVNSSSVKEPSADDPNPQQQADYHWRAPGYIPVSDHAPDAVTMDAFLGWLDEQPADLPQFAFVNLGDVDRAGHADEAAGMSSGAFRPFRQASIEDTDQQLAMLVDRLESDEAWDDTIMIVLSDHGMDYGPQDNQLSLTTTLTDAGFTVSENGVTDAHVVGGGGSGLVWVADKADIAPMAKVLAEADGVDFVSVREPIPTGPGEDIRQTTHGQMGFANPRAPDIEVFVEDGWHVGDGSNVLPGNHAHYATQHSMLMVAGGHPAVRHGVSVPGDTVYAPGQQLYAPPAGGPGVVSVAPTVAEAFGIGEPPGGYDAGPLDEAIDAAALPAGPVCGPKKAEPPADDEDAKTGGDDTGGGTSPPPPDLTARHPSPRRTNGIVWTGLEASKNRVRAGRRVTLSGRVLSDPGCSGPFRVLLRKHPRLPVDQHGVASGATGTSIRVGADRRWRVRVRADRTAEYAATVHPTRTCGSGTGVTTVVEVAARITAFVPRRCRRGRVVSGRIFPPQPATRVLLQRRRGSRWVTVVRRRVGHHSEFGFPLPGCRGRYRIVWPRQGVVSLRGTKRLRLR